MIKKQIFAGVAALGLMATPVLAQADLSVQAVQPINGENALGGKNSGTIALVAVLATLLVSALLLTGDDNDGDDDPISA